MLLGPEMFEILSWVFPDRMIYIYHTWKIELKYKLRKNFRGAECVTGHYLMTSELGTDLQQGKQPLYAARFNLKQVFLNIFRVLLLLQGLCITTELALG